MKKYLYLCLLLSSFNTSAVNINHQGLGEVLIIPYYTVNNNLNTLVVVTNPTATSKAIKINIREGLNGHAVLSYNVYLSPFDSWSFVFVHRTSTIAGFVGQDSVANVTSDTSCAPYLIKSGQEFLPFELTDGPQDMNRSKEGYIEVIEMGELQGELANAAGQSYLGVPNDCAALAAAWQPGGAWDADSGGDANQDLTAASGGLMVEADIINVSEGINFSIPVTALDNFFAANEINHVSPGDTSLSLDAAEPVAMLIANDDFYQLAFESGVDAVSAVLMKVELIGTYALDTFVAGKSEMILSQPTRRFYFDPGSVDTSPPFNTDRFVELCPESIYGGTEIESDIFDRESLFDYSYYGNGTSKNSPRPPTLPDPAICGSVFVQSISLPSNQIEPPSITQSDNYMVSTTPVAAVTESGYVITRFLDSRPLLGTQINSNQTVQLMGLPIIGVSLQQFTNAGAALGLLAQYGGSAQMKSKVSVVE